MRRLVAAVLIGPPAIGKTHLREALVSRGYFPIEFSVAIREVAGNNSHIEWQVKRRMNRGKLINDDLANVIFEDYISRQVPRGQNIVIDGYPRTESQSDHLAETLPIRGYKISCVFLEAPDEALFRRLATRKVTVLRTDDDVKVYEDRLKTYRKHLPSIQESAKRVADRIISIDATPERELVAMKLLQEIGV